MHEGVVVTASCLDMLFYYAQVDDMCHRFVGASVVVDLLLHLPLGVVYLLCSLLVLELKAVDTQYPGQKGRICSYRYHCLSALSPRG